MGCGQESDEPLRLRAMVAFPPRDTIRFELPATSHQCNDARSFLLEAVSPEGSGVLLRVRYGDSLMSDSVPIIPAGDTTTTPAATVAVRYFIRDAPHGVVLDSGRVHVRRDGGKIAARIEGVGLENAIRTPARIEYRDVPMWTDTVPCNHAP